MLEFEKVAPYLGDPLVLVGFFVFVFFSFCRYLLKKGVIPPIGKAYGYRVLRLILLYGFIFGLAIIGLGFGLKYRSLSQAEQHRAVNLLKIELEKNTDLVFQLAANLEKLVSGYEVVARVLRDERFPVLATLFPEANLKRDFSNPTPHELAVAALRQLEQSGLTRDTEALRKADELGHVIVATIDRTLPTVISLSDSGRSRYVLRRTAYEGNVDVLRRIEYVDLSMLPATYADLEKARANYDVVVANLIAYLHAVREFFKQGEIDETTLTAVLTAERLSTSVLLSYTPELVATGESLRAQTRSL